MTKEERAKVLAALNIGRIVAQDDDGNYTREITPKRITEAIAIMRKEPEPDPCRSLLIEWEEGLYDGQDFLRRVRLALHGPLAKPKEPEPISDADAMGFAVMEHLGPSALTGGTMTILEAFELGWNARALLEKAR